MFPGSSKCCTVSKSFDNGVIDISNYNLLPYQVVSLGYFLSKSDHKPEIELPKLIKIGDHDMSILHQHLRKDKANKQEIVKSILVRTTLLDRSIIISHCWYHQSPSGIYSTSSTLKVLNFNANKLRDLGTELLSKRITI